MSSGKFSSREGRVLRLTKPRFKGILRIIFSRITFIALMIILQVVILVMLYLIFEEYVANINAIMVVFSVLMVIYLYNSNMDSTSKLTWMMLIGLFPVPGALFLGFTRLDFGSRSLKRSLIAVKEKTSDRIPQDPKILQTLEDDGGNMEDIYRYMSKTGNFPVFENTSAKYYSDGHDFFEKILEDLETAKDYIYMEYFIIGEGYMWGRVLDILARKASEGVDVRVMYDGMCEIKLLPPDYPERMKKLGIQCREFSKIYPFLSTYYNYRDHRKITVIDGRIAYTGGVNFSDEYINLEPRFGHWKDNAIRLEGDAVRSFVQMFLELWNMPYPDPSFDKVDNFEPHKVDDASGFIMPFSDSPLDSYQSGEAVFLDTLGRSEKYVHIMTPYLIIDDTMKNALKLAALRDIDVVLILPGIPDKAAAYAIAKSHYKELITAGVKIYEYAPGFVHAKAVISDDIRAMVGSINLDYRSLYHHFECAAYLYKNDAIADIEKDFQETILKSNKVTFESIKNEKIGYKLAAKLLKFVAPLM
ncbi:MAG: cardiolipin synthase [Saccharofermentans sp.]|nr:cardiolipin synthase [Saccharofermentans sp.]